MFASEYKRNIYSIDKLLGRAVRMTKYGHMNFKELCSALRELAMKGCPAEMMFNEYLIHFNSKDEYGNFRLHFYVVNKVTGSCKVFETKAYVGASGKVMWRRLGSDMIRV